MNTAIISDCASNGRRIRRADQHGAGPLLGELRGGKVTRGVIGAQIGEVPSDDYQVLGLDALRGVIVSTVAPDGPADEAGIESGDVIVAYAGEPVEDSLDLQRRVVGTRPGTGVAVDVVRNGEPVTLDVTIGELNLDAREPQRDGGRGREDQRGLRHHPAGPSRRLRLLILLVKDRRPIRSSTRRSPTARAWRVQPAGGADHFRRLVAGRQRVCGNGASNLARSAFRSLSDVDSSCQSIRTRCSGCDHADRSRVRCSHVSTAFSGRSTVLEVSRKIWWVPSTQPSGVRWCSTEKSSSMGIRIEFTRPRRDVRDDGVRKRRRRLCAPADRVERTIVVRRARRREAPVCPGIRPHRTLPHTGSPALRRALQCRARR